MVNHLAFAVLLALLTLCCATSRPSAPPESTARGSVLAAVEGSDGIDVLIAAPNQSWKWLVSLPAGARALRFTTRGEVFWLEDDLHGPKPVVHAFTMLLRAGSLPQRLAPEAVPLIVRMPHRSALPSPAALRIESDCLTPAPPALCGTALRLLDWEAPFTLLAATNALAIEQNGSQRRQRDLTGVVDGRLTRTGALLVHRVNEHGQVADAVSLWEANDELRELLRAPIVIWAEQSPNGDLLAVRRAGRHDLYEALLAHAPEEFGGEALGGEAIHLEAHSGRAEPVRGLEGRSVRALVALDGP